MNIRDTLIMHEGRRFAKNAIMMESAKQWCKLNPGKKVLIARSQGSVVFVLSYYAGSKVFIYSPVKEPEYTVSIDEYPDWVRELYLRNVGIGKFGKLPR